MNDLDYQLCTKTVLDTSQPNISFDANGISNHYWEYKKNVLPYWFKGEEGEAILEKRIQKIKNSSKTKDFDCILGLSGGLDSSYMLHLVVKKYNLKPLVFHVDAGWNTNIAVSNINKMINKLNLDLFTEVINWEEVKDFQLAMFKSGLPNIDVPQDLAFIGCLYKFASKYEIKTILNGGNISTEAILTPLDYFYWGTDMKLIKDILNQFGTIEMKTYPFVSILYHKLWLKYFKRINVFKPLNFIDYNKNEAIKELESEYSWTSYPQKHFESRFTRFFEGYWLPKRFQYDVRRVQFSSLILSNQMERSVALKLLERSPLTEEVEQNEFHYIANKLQIDKDMLLTYFNIPKKYYWDYKNSKKFFDVGEKVLKLISGERRGGSI